MANTLVNLIKGSVMGGGDAYGSDSALPTRPGGTHYG